MNDQPPNKKGKITLDKISLPRLKPILYLICDICGEKVYDYKSINYDYKSKIINQS